MSPVYDELGIFEVRDDLYFVRGARNAAAPAKLFRALGAGEGPVIIKPNWFSAYPGQFTDAATLALVCDAIEGPKIVVEGHSACRNDGSREITPENGRENWDWIRAQERDYFARFGLDEVLARDDVTYINITDEVWEGRVVPAEEVRAAVEDKGGSLAFEEIYGVMPAALMEWRGRPLLSLARIKLPDPAGAGAAFSLSLKNMFGLLPEPNRADYHSRLPDAVVDAHVLYGAFFPVLGVCEGIYHVVRVAEEGEYDTVWGDRYDDLPDLGVVVAGARPAETDAFTGALFGLDLSGRDLMAVATERLGGWDRMIVLEASRYGLDV